MSLCNDPEGWQLLTNYYDVSPCVSQNVFFILPGSVAALFGVPAVVHLYFQPGKRPAVWSYTLKQVSISDEGYSKGSSTNTTIPTCIVQSMFHRESPHNTVSY